MLNRNKHTDYSKYRVRGITSGNLILLDICAGNYSKGNVIGTATRVLENLYEEFSKGIEKTGTEENLRQLERIIKEAKKTKKVINFY